ncbi:uncharacterized protein TNCV_3425811 [Trichonephila clavipes]|nr:uncharacterized protein TNCV_3425811 [Trichonephila clavipes]
MQAVEMKIRQNERLTITILSLEFPYASQSVVYKIVTEDLSFKKLCSRRVPRLLTDEHKQKRCAIPLHFLIRYEKEGDYMVYESLLEMKHEYPITSRNQSNSRWNGATYPRLARSSQKSDVKAQDYGSSFLGTARCFAGGLCATRNNN